MGRKKETVIQSGERSHLGHFTRLILLFCTICAIQLPVFGQSSVVTNLKSGKDQYVVVYGTSLSSGGHGMSWMNTVADTLNARYPGNLTFDLCGKGGMWSTWGVQHLEDSVIEKNPDVVIIEFGINDAFREYKTSPELARTNLVYMIHRIRLNNNQTEIILQVMNMAIGKSGRYRPNLLEYYSMYRDIARREDLILIDHYPNWQKVLDQGEDIFLGHVPDGIHPNDKSGREIIAPEIIKTLEN